MKKAARRHEILLEPTQSFTCVDWRQPMENSPLQYHLEYTIIALVEARGTRCIGDNVEPFQDGDLFLIAPKLPFYWMKNDPRPVHHIVSATFDENCLGGGFFEIPEAEEIRRLLADSRRGISFPRNVFTAIVPGLIRLSRLKGWARLCLFLEILGQLAAAPKARLLTSEGFSSELEELDKGRLSAVCKYVHDSYSHEIWEKKAAALAGFSPAPFSRFFHKRMGRTFVSYVTEVRISEACRKLTETDEPIINIAFEAGFNNLSNFNRHFLKLKGMTPRDYRRLHMETLARI